MPVLTKEPTLGDLLKYELNGNYSREVVTLKAGTLYPLGAVLGRITASGLYRLSPVAAVTGDEGAETAVAQQWIEAHQQDLRAALREQGLDLGSFLVRRQHDDPDDERPPERDPDTPRRRPSAKPDVDAPRFEVIV